MNHPPIDNALEVEDPLAPSTSEEPLGVLDGESFRRRIAVERKRTERNKDPFLLMLLETDGHVTTTKIRKSLDKVITALLPTIRETDVIGWYREGTTVGVLFTGLATGDNSSLLGMILGRITTVLRNELTFEQFSQICISFHFFPDDWDSGDTDGPSNLALYPDLQNSQKRKRFASGIKRAVDIAGSILLLIACTPLFAVIAAAIKLTSKGPVFFKQQRVGQCGKHFTFIKFRSMYANNDHTDHLDYVQKLIAGKAERMSLNGQTEGVYKLANDRRITMVGKFLRRSSLDELPQFFNVLWGDMSLVGPRPPIPYELTAYQTWHRRRLLQVKPGITGLWQVGGRNLIPFDDMVRLDLQYAASWTPWMDLKILIRTPGAVIRGAY